MSHQHRPKVVAMQNLGLDWDERVLPSIGNEIVKAAVAQYNAEQLLTQRDRVSRAVSLLCSGAYRASLLLMQWAGMNSTYALSADTRQLDKES